MAILNDGFSTTIDFGQGAVLVEKTSTPPGLTGGGEIDTTTMANTTWRTRYPKALVTLSEASITAAYDPSALTTLLSLLNVNASITVTFPDTSTLVFWGWLDEFTPGEAAEGEQPTAECTIIPSNVNASGVETAPVFTAASP
jgi:hypothetical protein